MKYLYSKSSEEIKEQFEKILILFIFFTPIFILPVLLLFAKEEKMFFGYTIGYIMCWVFPIKANFKKKKEEK